MFEEQGAGKEDPEEVGERDKDREKRERKQKKKERRRSLGIHFLSSSQEGEKVLRGAKEGGIEDPMSKRWSGDYGDQSHQKPAANTSSTTPKKDDKGDGRKKILSVKLPEHTKGKKGLKSPTSASGGPISPNANTNGVQPPPAPPPPVVSPLPEASTGALLRGLGEVYCYSDRRDPDFREEMLRREEERKKLVEMKKDLEKLEMESQRRKKESVKDENKKARWGLLFSLPSDVRKLKEELVDDYDDDGDDAEDPKYAINTKEMEERLRLLDMHVERTISQLLLVDPEEGEKLLAQKRAEEERRKKILEGQEEEEV